MGMEKLCSIWELTKMSKGNNNRECIHDIQKEKAKEIEENGLPKLDSEINKVAQEKRMTLDEPVAVAIQDPLR